MTNPLTIITYHYIKDFSKQPNFDLKWLTTKQFIEQIKYLKKHYSVITPNDLVEAVAENKNLPEMPALLTFDDGYAEHFSDVLPVLSEKGLKACFFPVAISTAGQKVLKCNKVQFIIASDSDKKEIVKLLMARIDENRQTYGIPDSSTYWSQFGKPDPSGYFSSSETNFFHRMLLRELPASLSQTIADEMFRLFVTADESGFARRLYMSSDQVRHLVRHGMCIGSHTYEHPYLDTLTPEAQEAEIDQSLSFIRDMGADMGRWMMCYPYGAHSRSLLPILQARNCSVGLTTYPYMAYISSNHRLLLPRLDATEFPLDANAEPCKWTKLAMQQRSS